MQKMKKQGIDFFPVDVNFLSGYNIRRVTKSCGIHATAVIIELLGRIYQWEGYFIPYNEETIFSLADFLGLEEKEVEKITLKAVLCKVFDREKFEK